VILFCTLKLEESLLTSVIRKRYIYGLMASKTAGFVEQDRSNMNCLDILAGVVSNCSHSSNDENPSLLLEVKNENEVAGRLANPPVHRVSCHRCGNLRRKIIVCERPQVS
jgi:hypothetical protein